MKLAILLWFYKEPEICENRLKIIKKFNPGLKIFGLYGGDLNEVDKYKEKLGEYLDDFYIFEGNEDSYWKWINGDLLILDWYEKRGKELEWDSVAVIQWDLLIFDSLKNQFKGLEKDQIFLSGFRSLDKELENRWDWTKPGGEERENYLNFLNYVKEKYKYSGNPSCCLFMFQVFPRIFFDKYLTVENREVGMLEYKIPMYAKIFGIPFYEKDIGVAWGSPDNLPVNSVPKEIEAPYINAELSKPDGWRIFHPVYKFWDETI